MAEKTPDWVQKVEAAGPDDLVLVRHTDGRRGSVPRKALPQLFAENNDKGGWSLEAPEQTKDVLLEQEYGDRGGQAFLQGVARGFTLGLSDATIGQLDEEGFRETKKRNAGWSTFGEVTGAIGGSFIGGTPANLALRAGTSVERAAASKLAGRYIPKVVGGATEGVIYGAGTGLGNAVIEEGPVSAELLLSEVGTGALLGGAGGAAGGAAFQFLDDAAKAGRNYTQRAVNKFETVAAGRDPLEAVLAKPSKAVEAQVRAERAGIVAEKESIFGARKAAVDYAEASGKRADEAIGRFKSEYEVLDRNAAMMLAEARKTAAGIKRPSAANDFYTDGFKVKKGIPKYTRVDDEGVLYEVAARDLHDSGLYELPMEALDANRINRVRAQWDRGGKHDPIRLSMDKDGRFFIEDGRHRLRVALEQDRNVIVRVNSAADGAFDNTVRINAPPASRMSPELQASIRELEEATESARSLTGVKRTKASEKERYAYEFGDTPTMATVLRNPALDDVLRRQEDALYSLRTQLGGFKSKKTGEEFDVIRVSRDPVEAVKTWDEASAAATAGLDDMRLAWLDQRFADLDVNPTVRSAAQTVEAGKRAGIKLDDADILAAARESDFPNLKSLDELGEDAAIVVRAQAYRNAARREMEKRSGMSGLATGALTGIAASWMLDGGPVGALLTGLLGSRLGGLAKGSLYNAMRGVRGKMAAAGAKVAKGVDTFLEGVGKTAQKAPRSAAAVLASASFGESDKTPPKGGSELRKAFHQRAAEIVSTLAPGELRLRERIRDRASGLSVVDPTFQAQFEDLAYRRLLFLYERMPKNPGLGSPLALKAGGYEPSDAEIAKWSRYVEAAEGGPAAVISHLASGTLTVEHVEALETLYPDAYNRIKIDLVDRIPQLRAELNWNQRLTLSTFFKVPVDSVMRPAMVQTLQATWVPSEKGPEPGGTPPAPPSSAAQPTSAQRLSGATA